MNTRKVLDNIFTIRKNIKYPKSIQGKDFLIICPTDGYKLSKKQFEEIVKVLKKHNLLSNVYMLDIEFLETDFELCANIIKRHTDFTYDSYQLNENIFENAIVDEDLRWSISIFQDFWAIFFCTTEVVMEIASNPVFKDDLNQLNLMIDVIDNRKVREDFQKLVYSASNNNCIKKDLGIKKSG